MESLNISEASLFTSGTPKYPDLSSFLPKNSDLLVGFKILGVSRLALLQADSLAMEVLQMDISHLGAGRLPTRSMSLKKLPAITRRKERTHSTNSTPKKADLGLKLGNWMIAKNGSKKVHQDKQFQGNKCLRPFQTANFWTWDPAPSGAGGGVFDSAINSGSAGCVGAGPHADPCHIIFFPQLFRVQGRCMALVVPQLLDVI